MPGWHEKVKDLVASKQLVLLGVTQEQHAERCVLFAKWKRFDWPILHDPINSLGCQAVPITIAIDEMGIVQSTNPKEAWLRKEFIGDVATASKPSISKRKQPKAEIPILESMAKQSQTAGGYQTFGDAIMLWHPKDCNAAVDAYRAAIAKEDSASLHFRLGVALRHRFESPAGSPKDFGDAVSHWMTALRMDPNQYIWRRRIQQYGPRLDKPYPFYDWVDEALADLSERGDKYELRVQLSGAEIAQPSKQRSPQTRPLENPDPDGKITRDLGQLVKISSTVVPSSKKGVGNVRLHLQLEPAAADWNNEAGPMQIWFERSDNYSTSTSLVEYQPKVGTPESREKRLVEAELAVENGGSAAIRGFVLYYVCEKSSMQCIFRRQDFVVPIKM